MLPRRSDCVRIDKRSIGRIHVDELQRVRFHFFLHPWQELYLQGASTTDHTW